MDIMVIGAKGQLGTDLCRVYGDARLHAVDIDTLNICDARKVQAMIGDIRPDAVVNAAAAHNVPACEEDPATAFAVNAAGARNVAMACRAVGAKLVFISTDYVFGNGGARPYVETDLPAPLNVYAASKLAGEHLVAAECPDHHVVRTAALYGSAPCVAKGGKNFVNLMLHLAQTRPEVKVVTDEITTPTYTLALADQIRALVSDAPPGLYHATCNGFCSWYDFAKAIFEETATAVNLVPTTSAEFPSTVRRPSYSVLQNKRLQDLGLDVMPHWRDALRAYLAEERERANAESNPSAAV